MNQKVWRRKKALSDAAKHFNAKLAPSFVGSFWIKRRVGTTTYELMNNEGKACGVWHVQDLKPYQAGEDKVEGDSEV